MADVSHQSIHTERAAPTRGNGLTQLSATATRDHDGSMPLSGLESQRSAFSSRLTVLDSRWDQTHSAYGGLDGILAKTESAAVQTKSVEDIPGTHVGETKGSSSGDATTQFKGGGKAPPPPPSGGGDALPGEVRVHMEKALGGDFSDVRVHQDDLATSVGAQAFARGTDLHFAPGRYDPGSDMGLSLLGHELTHVVQQKTGRVAPPGEGSGGVVNDAGLETEADVRGAQAAASYLAKKA